MGDNKMQLKLIGKTNFRELFHRIIYIIPTEAVRSRLENSIPVCCEDDGFLAYGYIDNQAGFSFRILCSANIRNGELVYGEYDESNGYIIRRGLFDSCSFIDAEYLGVTEADFNDRIREYIAVINECYQCREDTVEMRKLSFLDDLRSSDYPDDIRVILYQEGMQPEQVWIKCYTYTDKELFGLLLNEPHQDFGVHNGSIIGFAPLETENGIICIYTGRWLEKVD